MARARHDAARGGLYGHGGELRCGADDDGSGDGALADGASADGGLPHAAGAAVADAAAILRAFVLAPGGQRLAKAPDALKVASSTVVSTSLSTTSRSGECPASRSRYWPGSMAHLPRRFMPGDESYGPSIWDRTFSLAPVPGVLNGRDLVVEVAAAGNGQTVVRVARRAR